MVKNIGFFELRSLVFCSGIILLFCTWNCVVLIWITKFIYMYLRFINIKFMLNRFVNTFFNIPVFYIVCLIVCFNTLFENISSYGQVTIFGEGLQNLGQLLNTYELWAEKEGPLLFLKDARKLGVLRTWTDL